MIKLIHYVNPADSSIWCIEVEYKNENNKPVFKAYYDEFTIQLIQSDTWKEQLKENTGQNIATVYISEEPEE